MTTPSPTLLAPLFRATFESRAAAGRVLKHPEFRGWVATIIGGFYSKFPTLYRPYPKQSDFAFHILGHFAQRVLAPKSGSPGLATKSGAPPDEPANWIARILRNLVFDELRRLKQDNTHERPLDETAHAGTTDHLEPAPDADLHSNADANRAIARFRDFFANNHRRYIIAVAHFYPLHVTRDDIVRAAQESNVLFVRTPDETLRRLKHLGTGTGIETIEIRRHLAWIFSCNDPLIPSFPDWERHAPDDALKALDTLRKAFNLAIGAFKQTVTPGEWP